MAKQFVVDQPAGSLVKGSIDSDNITFGDEFLQDSVSD